MPLVPPSRQRAVNLPATAGIGIGILVLAIPVESQLGGKEAKVARAQRASRGPLGATAHYGRVLLPKAANRGGLVLPKAVSLQIGGLQPMSMQRTLTRGLLQLMDGYDEDDHHSL